MGGSAKLYTRLMTSWKKFFMASYNLGQATEPQPLPNNELRLQILSKVLSESPAGKTVSVEIIRKAISSAAEDRKKETKSESSAVSSERPIRLE